MTTEHSNDSSHLHASPPEAGVTGRLIRITTALAVAAVAAAAAVISYWHAYELVTTHGDTAASTRHARHKDKATRTTPYPGRPFSASQTRPHLRTLLPSSPTPGSDIAGEEVAVHSSRRDRAGWPEAAALRKIEASRKVIATLAQLTTPSKHSRLPDAR